MNSERSLDDVPALWDISLNIGIPLIDEQHQAIAALGRTMLLNSAQPVNSDTFSGHFASFFRLVALHFDSEELHMKNMQLPEALMKVHFDEHTRLLEQLVQVSCLAAAGKGPETVADIAQDMVKIVIDHVAHLDRSLGRASLSA